MALGGDDTIIDFGDNPSVTTSFHGRYALIQAGDGKDVIFGFDNNDMLEITGTFSATYNKTTKAVAFKVGSTASAITLKNFTATTFNINGDTYIINGSSLKKK